MKLAKQLLLPALIILVLLPFIIPLFTKGFGYSDGGWMVVRLSAFHETLKGGQFPVRFLERLNHGYGYPVLNFLYPLPFYLGEVIHLLGFGFVDSIALLFALSILGGAAGMYFYVGQKWGKVSGVYAAILYSIFPYHLFDIFVRGSLGEAMAFLFLPYVFFLSDQVVKPSKNRVRWAILLAISLACLITSHNTLSVIFAPIIGLYWLIEIVTHKQSTAFIISGVLALSLAAFFWIPALFELSSTRAPVVEVAKYAEYFLTGANFTELLGGTTIAIIVTLIVTTVRQTKRPSLSEKNLHFLLFLLSSLLALAVSTRFLEILWQGKMLVQLVQFPWRFLAIPTLGLSIVGAVAFSQYKRGGILILSLLVLLQMTNLTISGAPRDENLYSTNDDTTTVKNEYMPLWVKRDSTNLPSNYIEILEGEGTIIPPSTVTLSTNSLVQINKVYFPGTRVYARGVELPIKYEQNGLIQLSLTPGTYILSRKFTETPLRMFANTVSVLGAFGAVSLFLFPYAKDRLTLIMKKKRER